MLRGQASLQDIIGKPQSWRAGKTKQRNQKPISHASEEALSAPVKEERVDTPTYQRKQVPTPAQHESRQQAQVKEKSKTDAATDALIRSESQMLRRSPRKAQVVAQPPAAPDCPLHCPVCSKMLPASILEINRHIGNAPTPASLGLASAFSLHPVSSDMVERSESKSLGRKQPSKRLSSMTDG